MGIYSLSGRAQSALIGIFTYDIKFFGLSQSPNYLLDLESFLGELVKRPKLTKDASTIARFL